MADDGGYSVWGTDDDDDFSARPTHQSVSSISPPKRSSKLFDDLEETTADWSIQVSPPIQSDSKRHSLLDESLATDFSDSGTKRESDSKQPEIEDDLADRLNSAGFDDFQDGQFQTADDEMKGGNDDDFGDFGDFEEEQEAAFDGDIVAENIAGPSREWRPLSINKDTDAASLESSIREILAPALPNGRMYPFHDGAASQLSQDRIRQVEGEAQVLVREESRIVWHSLTAQPKVRPVDWMRSSTRRQHLIALGIPINLDEVRVGDTAGSKSLPPLSLKLDKKPGEIGNGKQTPSRNSPADSREARIPVLDVARANQLTSLTEDQLTLMSLPALRDITRELETLTGQASALLTHYLSQRESHNADAEMYNGLIRNLVTGAASKFGPSTSVKRSSTLRKTSTNSGRNSPAPSTQVR